MGVTPNLTLYTSNLKNKILKVRRKGKKQKQLFWVYLRVTLIPPTWGGRDSRPMGSAKEVVLILGGSFLLKAELISPLLHNSEPERERKGARVTHREWTWWLVFLKINNELNNSHFLLTCARNKDTLRHFPSRSFPFLKRFFSFFFRRDPFSLQWHSMSPSNSES